MTNFSNLQVPPPSNWQDFETLCRDLWREIWKDSNTQKNGRQGQRQHGVDIYGRPDLEKLWAGVQCKGKDNTYEKKSISKYEVKTEVEKAKLFAPKLSEFIIATTGPKDQEIEQMARTITDKHLKCDLFSVHIWGWKDIVERLEDFPDVTEKHYPGLNPNTQASYENIDDIKKLTQTSLENQANIKEAIYPLSKKINKLEYAINVNQPDISMDILTPEYQAELDHARDLIENHKGKEALVFLEGLKNRCWSNANPIVKFRIVTNIGAAKLSLNCNQEASKLFIEALQYNPTDEKALCNASLAYLLIGQYDKAKNYAEKVLELNPANSNAYSLLIQTFPSKYNLTKIIAKVPEQYRNSCDVAYAISFIARKMNDQVESKKWLEIADSNNKDGNPDVKGALGTMILELVTKEESIIYGDQLSNVQREQILKAIKLLNFAWNSVVNTDIQNLRLDWLLNRAIAKDLAGEIDDAIKDAETLLELDPLNPIFIRQRAFLSFKKDDDDKTLAILKKIQSSKEVPEAPLLIAETLLKKKKFLEAIDVVKVFLENKPSKHLKEEADRLLIFLYVKSEDFENAKKLSCLLRSANTTNILYLVDAAIVEKFLGNSKESLRYLNEANEKITKHSSFRELLVLADEFYNVEYFEKAAIIYERIVCKSGNSPLTYKLLNSYYRSGERDKTLEICRNLCEKFGPLKYVSEMESAIYEEIGNLAEAKKICGNYLNVFPNDFRIKLRLAVVNLRLNDFNAVDNFLNSYFDIKNFSLEEGLQLVYLYYARNLKRKALEILYEIRRMFFKDSKAHLKYVFSIFDIEKDIDDLFNITNVCVDSVVCVEDDSGEKQLYIIEDRNNDDVDIARKEINIKHPLAQKLLNKKVGDMVLLSENLLSNQFGKVISVTSKYIHAHSESLSLFERLFPHSNAFLKFNITDVKDLQKIFDLDGNPQVVYKKIEQFYIDWKSTIGMFAQFINKSVIDVWNSIKEKPEVGVKCSFGSHNERQCSLLALSKRPKLIIDLIAVMTLHCINFGNEIIKAFGKFGIAQSTLDEVQNLINEREGFFSKGFVSIGKDADEFTRLEVSRDDVKRNVEYLKNIKTWIGNNCEIMPCNAALNINRKNKLGLNKMIGTSFIDTILIASDDGNMLYSDDAILRTLAKNEYDVDGIWTQILLMYCLDNKEFARNEYNKMAIKLINYNYYHTSIDADILLEAALLSNWKPTEPYTSVLNKLNGKYTDEDSTLNVATNFLYKLYQTTILAHQRDYMILSLLTAVTNERNRRNVLSKLVSHVRSRFRLLPIAEKEIITLVKIWKDQHVI